MAKSFTLHDLPKEERPRERLIKFGEHVLSAQELLQLIEYGQKWCRLYILKKSDIPLAVKAIQRSFKLINYCIENKIPTGWYAEPEE